MYTLLTSIARNAFSKWHGTRRLEPVRNRLGSYDLLLVKSPDFRDKHAKFRTRLAFVKYMPWREYALAAYKRPLQFIGSLYNRSSSRTRTSVKKNQRLVLNTVPFQSVCTSLSRIVTMKSVQMLCWVLLVLQTVYAISNPSRQTTCEPLKIKVGLCHSSFLRPTILSVLLPITKHQTSLLDSFRLLLRRHILQSSIEINSQVVFVLLPKGRFLNESWKQGL